MVKQCRNQTVSHEQPGLQGIDRKHWKREIVLQPYLTNVGKQSKKTTGVPRLAKTNLVYICRCKRGGVILHWKANDCLRIDRDHVLDLPANIVADNGHQPLSARLVLVSG
jgi:hypothetical protein